MRVRQLEAAARWMLGGDETFRAPRALIFAVQPATLRRVFTQNVVANAPINDPESVMGASAALPSLTLIVAPFGPERSLEFTPLQSFYGSLVPTFESKLKGWPSCIQQGIEAMLSAATFEENDHLLLDTRRFPSYTVLEESSAMSAGVVREHRHQKPAELLTPGTAPPTGEVESDDRAYGCLILSHWYVASNADRHRAFDQLFTSIAQGKPVAEAIPAALGANLDEFTKRYHEYVHDWRMRPKDFFIRAVLPNLKATIPEPVPVPAERFQAFMHQMCTKLSRCRS